MLMRAQKKGAMVKHFKFIRAIHTSHRRENVSDEAAFRPDLREYSIGFGDVDHNPM
jgi:hypothetical protein